MTKYWNGLGAAGLIVGMMWALSIDNPQRPSSVTKEADVQLIQREFKPVQPTRSVSASVSAKIEVKPIITPVPEKPFQYQAELDSFLKFKGKVFLTEQEKAERNRLLHDASLLRALGLRLTEASLAPSVTASQDAAVDLLIEALKSGDNEMASQVAKSVVEDSQVENTSLERGVRENLAGIKAEVLYHWAAMSPDSAGIERYLPGPVSQKIWANVNRRHASNTAESNAEIAKRPK